MLKTPEFNLALLEYLAAFLDQKSLHDEAYKIACADTNKLVETCKVMLDEKQQVTFIDYTETAAYKSTREWQVLYELGYKDCIIFLKTIGIL